MRQGEAESEILIGGCAVKNFAMSISATSEEVAMPWDDEPRTSSAALWSSAAVRYAALRSNDCTRPPTYDRTSILFRDNLRTAFGARLRTGSR